MQSSNPIDIPVPMGRFKSNELAVVQSEDSQQEEILKNTQMINSETDSESESYKSSVNSTDTIFEDCEPIFEDQFEKSYI